ncbi:hypothetical protein TIFTF001_040875 [Ficus carica]|uniref:Uncharacterized protein n=1 Tax=Ficus carica TaxID=3494 RepID=A0AA87Z6S6_FICCA|nr:hypothetical protein TIFTF001_040866 [Ficus carica]GMN26592.1 hypothetical protein TIFTF001_040875 [Ficus carica]
METPNTIEPNLTTPSIPSSSSAIQSTPATFSLPSPSMRKSSASKLYYLYEINYVPDEQKIISEDLPIINPYHAFVKQSNPMLRTIKQLVRPTSKMVREYVQSTKFSFCPACINDHSNDDHHDRPKKISSGKKLKKRHQHGDKQVGTLGQPSGKFDFLVTYSPPPRTDGPIIPTGWEEDPDDHPRSSSPPSPPEVPPVLPCYKQAQKYLRRTGQQPITPIQMTPPTALPQICMMFSANYEEDFPPLQPATTNDGIETRQPKVLNSRTVEPDGTVKRVAPAEAVLNWQSENLIAQNKVLQKINHKLSQVDSKIDQSNIGLIRSQTILERLESQIQMLHKELRSLAMTSSFSSRLFAEKEAEMKSLQTQLTALQKQAHRGFAEPSEVPWRFTAIPKQEQPLPAVPQKEDHIKRLMRLLDEDDALRKIKGKQKELSSSSQMMVQPQPQRQNPLTAMIKNYCAENLPQIQVLDPNTSSEEESVPEDSDWSSDVSTSSEPEANKHLHSQS